MRDFSKYKILRTKAAALYGQEKTRHPAFDRPREFIAQLEKAFYFSMMITYAQGLHLLSQGSKTYNYNLHLDEIAKIWRGGCIIRSKFLADIYKAYQDHKDLEHLLLSRDIQALVKESLPSARTVVAAAVLSGLATPAYASSLTYFDVLRSENMPSNLIQAQRDYFGAHTYELVGQEGVFHANWNSISKV
jgi:6-phosphogluconate dehydrogenase